MNKVKVSNLYTFSDTGLDDGTIKEGNCFISNSLSGDELSIDTLNFTVIFPLSGQTNIVLTKLPYGTELIYYNDNVLIGKFYLTSVTRVEKNKYNIKGVSGIGLLDNSTHYGGIYTGQTANIIIADIFSDIAGYTVDEVFKQVQVFGWLPIDTRRKNLHQLLFAIGGCLKKDSTGVPFITVLDNAEEYNIEDNRIFLGGSIDYNSRATAVEVYEHTFVNLNTDKEDVLFDGEAQSSVIKCPSGVTREGTLVAFKQPYHDLAIEGTSILESGVNYAVLSPSSQCKLKGLAYTHTTRVVKQGETQVYIIAGAAPYSKGWFSKSNGGSSFNPSEGFTYFVQTVGDYYKKIYRWNGMAYEDAGESYIVKVDEDTIVSLANSANIAERVYSYYSSARSIKNEIKVGEERPTDYCSFTDPFGEEAKAFIKEMDINMGGSFPKADTEFIVDYSPAGIGNYYTHSLVLPANGTYTLQQLGIKKKNIRIVAIGGGNGGSGGQGGTGGTIGAFSSPGGTSIFYTNEAFITSSQTWTVPEGVTHIKIALIGAGGNSYNAKNGSYGNAGSCSGGASSVTFSPGSGGAGGAGGTAGAGGYHYEAEFDVIPGETYQITVGSGGGASTSFGPYSSNSGSRGTFEYKGSYMCNNGINGPQGAQGAQGTSWSGSGYNDYQWSPTIYVNVRVYGVTSYSGGTWNKCSLSTSTNGTISDGGVTKTRREARISCNGYITDSSSYPPSKAKSGSNGRNYGDGGSGATGGTGGKGTGGWQLTTTTGRISSGSTDVYFNNGFTSWPSSASTGSGNAGGVAGDPGYGAQGCAIIWY